MTLHSAKGMEFSVVFIAGMEEGLFPHRRSTYNTSELEEVRRLCYVGMTRAKKKLHLSWAGKRNIFGNIQNNSESRFLKEIPTQYIKSVQGPHSIKIKTAKDNNLSSEFYTVGSAVHHSKFGHGIIKKKDGKGDKIQLVIDFKGDYRRLMAKYAKLQIIKKREFSCER